MAEGNITPDTSIPSVSQASEKSIPSRGRRTFLAGLLASAATVLFPRKTEAQGLFNPVPLPSAPNSPEKARDNDHLVLIPAGGNMLPLDPETYQIKETPAKFQEPILKAAKQAANFLRVRDEIKINFASPGKITTVAEHYNPKSEDRSIVNPKLNIHFSDEDNQPWAYTNLLVGEKLGLLVNKSFDGAIGDQFAGILLETAGVDLSKMHSGKATAEETSRLTQLLPYFDFANYTDGIKRQDLNKSLVGAINADDSLLEKTYSLWMFEARKLASKIEQSPSEVRKKIADVFLGGLICILNGADPNIKFDDLGLDRKSIDKILKVSGNNTYKKYIDEKSRYMGIDASKASISFDKYRAALSATSEKAA